MADVRICVSCGARLKSGAVVCDLCGEPVDVTGVASEHESSEDVEPAALSVAEVSSEEAASGEAEILGSEGVFCNQCGWKNPSGARFCSRCGSKLQIVEGAERPGPQRAAVRPAVPPKASGQADSVTEGQDSGEASQGELGKQITIIVGAGVMLVILLYALTMMSAGFNPTASGSNTGGPPTDLAATPQLQENAPLPPQIASRVSEIETELQTADGEAKLSKQIELVNLFIGAGRPDRAAVVQEEVAQVQNTPEAWTRAGNLFYDWMDALEGPRKTEIAKRTIAAYDNVLEQQPDNLDVRATKAIAHLYDPSNPMAAIQETNTVLEADPNHIQANFNRGLMLMQINRVDAAREQFEKLKTIVGEESPLYEQAEAIIQSLGQAPASGG